MTKAVIDNLRFLRPTPVKNKPIRVEKRNSDQRPGQAEWVTLSRTFNAKQVWGLTHESPQYYRVITDDIEIYVAEATRMGLI